MHVLIIAVSLIGGLLGILGSFVGELQAGNLPVIAVIVAAPIIEELFKPIGVFLALVRWRWAMASRLYRAVLCGLAGAVFGFIESTLYVIAFAEDAPTWFPEFRFTVPVAMHAIASYTVGLGLSARVVDWVNRGGKLPRDARNHYFAGVVIHAAYNTLAVALSLAGVFD